MKGTELNFLRVSNIWHRIYFANICKKNIFFILEVQFHHEGGLSKGRYFELFYSAGSLCPPCKISSFTEAPFYLFSDIFEILTNFVFQIILDFFSVPNLGHTCTNCTIFLVVGVKMSKKWMSALALFFYAPKPKGATLTYSAVEEVKNMHCSFFLTLQCQKRWINSCCKQPAQWLWHPQEWLLGLLRPWWPRLLPTWSFIFGIFFFI